MCSCMHYTIIILTNIFMYSSVAFFRFSASGYSVVENQGPLVGAVTLDTQGQLGEAITITISTISTGDAGGKYQS